MFLQCSVCEDFCSLDVRGFRTLLILDVTALERRMTPHDMRTNFATGVGGKEPLVRGHPNQSATIAMNQGVSVAFNEG